MKILRTREELVAARAAMGPELSVGLVPTMGFLHAGHVSLMERAREENDVVIATIFVNPTQFAEGEDLDEYPRDPDGDAQKCDAAGVDILWMPETPAVYDADHSTTVSVASLTNGLCGASRPTHFDGVTTIVAKLLNVSRATNGYFGEKDYQQLAVIRRMVRDLDMPVKVHGVPIVRDADGVALSSRNKYLSASERSAARLLWQSLERARQAVVAGTVSTAGDIVQLVEAHLGQSPHTDVDYIEVVDPLSLATIDDLSSANNGVHCALAVRVGTTRLIDNARLDAAVPVHHD